MRIFVSLVLTLAVSSPAFGSPKPPSAKQQLASLEAQYLDGLFRARPHLASFMGDHRFDDKVMDLSDAALAKRHSELTTIIAKAQAFDTSLPPTEVDAHVDLAILRDGAKLELLYLDQIRDWSWDPRLYDSLPFYDPREIVADRLSTLVHGDFAPEAERRKNAIAQLAALPRYLEQVRLAITKTKGRKAPKVYVEQAIKTNLGRLEFMKTELAPFLGHERSATAVFDKAMLALSLYQKFLEHDLKSSDGDWRLGRAIYDEKYRLALQTERTPDEMVKRAQADFAHARAELADVARKLHKQLWPTLAIADKSPAGEAALIGKVKDELAKHHAKPEELVLAHGKKLDALRAFIEQKHLVDLPPRDSLTVSPMPEYKRGSSAAEYLAPGMLDGRPDFHATYYVDPIDPTWDKERVESYLRGQNDYEVELIAAHEAYPGHHTQAAQERKDMSRLRATLWNGPMVEGWAVYSEGQMVTHGWGDKDNDRYRFFDLRGRMVSATNLILDVKLERGEMTDEEAVRFMVAEGFQERAMAEKKLLRAKLDSTQLCQYFLGLDELEQLRRDVEQQAKVAGRAFSEHDFHMAIVGHGSIAIPYLRHYLLPGAR